MPIVILLRKEIKTLRRRRNLGRRASIREPIITIEMSFTDIKRNLRVGREETVPLTKSLPLLRLN
jgi:hypothetical protein